MSGASASDPKVVQLQRLGIQVDLQATTSTSFVATDSTNANYFIRARLTGKILTFSVVTVDLINPLNPRSAIRGSHFFAAALDWFAAFNVAEINSTWLDQPGFDTNFQEFKKIYDPAIDNREEAVKATPSWKIVSRAGFTTIASISVFPPPPKKLFNTIEVLYTR